MPQFDKENGSISIKVYVDDCIKFFDGLDVNRNQIKKRLMRTTGQGASQAAKRGFTKTLRVRTGRLKKSITYRMDSISCDVTVVSTADSGKATYRTMGKRGRVGRKKNARYGYMLAWGYDIDASTSRGLRFQIDGQWKTRHHVEVKARDWIEPPVDRYADSADLKKRLDKEFQKQVDYWEKRITGGNLK